MPASSYDTDYYATTYVIADLNIEHSENAEQYSVLMIYSLIIVFVFIMVQNNGGNMLHNIHQSIKKTSRYCHILEVLCVIFNIKVFSPIFQFNM